MREAMRRAYEDEMREADGQEGLLSGENRRDIIWRHK